MSLRGVIATRTGRSPRRMTSCIISCSCGSITPAPVPSASTVSTSSWVTVEPSLSRILSRRSTAAVEKVSRVTNGPIIRASTLSGRETRAAIASGWIRASRLGTSSPTISET